MGKIDDRDLIAVALHGRLGNHLFQYAAGRALNLGRPVPVDDLRYPTVWLDEMVKPGSFRVITPRETLVLRQPPRLPRGRQLLLRHAYERSRDGLVARWFQGRQRFDKRPGSYDPSVRQLSGPVLLNGWFQNEGYFIDIADQLVDDFREPSVSAIDRLKSFRANVGSRQAVAVVVRAGRDYQNLGWTQSYGWYRSAAERLADRVPDPAFGVFSDVSVAAEAIAAALRDLGPAEPFVGIPPVDQLQCIAEMDHAIIADSSFGWWGAWLGDYRDAFESKRTVIAPDPWILPELDCIAPSRWVRHASDADPSKHRPSGLVAR